MRTKLSVTLNSDEFCHLFWIGLIIFLNSNLKRWIEIIYFLILVDHELVELWDFGPQLTSVHHLPLTCICNAQAAVLQVTSFLFFSQIDVVSTIGWRWCGRSGVCISKFAPYLHQTSVASNALTRLSLAVAYFLCADVNWTNCAMPLKSNVGFTK